MNKNSTQHGRRNFVIKISNSSKILSATPAHLWVTEHGISFQLNKLARLLLFTKKIIPVFLNNRQPHLRLIPVVINQH